ncbi:hypothetical protein AABB24_000562 [Solanum stoloniferum]|uniref:Uncharacterized protein n=1 Tax=Solanum stoloniferum TaxID=62892 RepID=A0ABD2VIQ8_9SOLN
MGLNEVYSNIRGNILMLKPLPTTAQAYSLILHEERQKEVHSVLKLTPDSAAFNIAATRTSAQKTSNESRRDYVNNGNFCSYCKKPGHEKDKCFRLHRFPTNFKFTKPRRISGYRPANCVATEDENALGSSSSSGTSSQGFTKEQCDQLLQMLQTMQAGNSIALGFEVNATANFAEPTSYRQGALHPGWQIAMSKELEAVETNRTWDVIHLPVGKLALHANGFIKSS